MISQFFVSLYSFYTVIVHWEHSYILNTINVDSVNSDCLCFEITRKYRIDVRNMFITLKVNEFLLWYLCYLPIEYRYLNVTIISDVYFTFKILIFKLYYNSFIIEICR